MDAAAFKKFVQADSDKWKRILEQTGLTKAAN
jgi:tripartite-type tricarboxylate transporter receptor subunit TctC